MCVDTGTGPVKEFRTLPGQHFLGDKLLCEFASVHPEEISPFHLDFKRYPAKTLEDANVNQGGLKFFGIGRGVLTRSGVLVYEAIMRRMRKFLAH